jgi:hypothetical protein
VSTGAPPTRGEGRRHALLGAAALGLAALAGWGAWRDRAGPPPTRPIPTAPGFRRLDTGASASGADLITLGLDAGKPPEPMPREALCAALFREDGPGVPVAVFSDYRCPTCPALASRLRGLGGPTLSITWHEWPILGPTSVFSAKVALAAGLQGRHDQMHAHLTRRFLRPSEAGAREAAEAIGLDAERLVADMQGPAVAARIAETARLAALFGFRGTPSAVVGATATEGLVDAGTLRRLAEAGAGPCRG